MSSNKRAKERLIQLFGEECFIEKLHLRIDEKPRVYKSKGELKRMKQLSYHHIKEKSKGGKATVENGALLSVENHAWFHKQPPHEQKRMNRIFQQYKKCTVEFVDDLDFPFEIRAITITPEELLEPEQSKNKHNRAKIKQETLEMIRKYEEGDDFER